MTTRHPSTAMALLLGLGVATGGVVAAQDVSAAVTEAEQQAAFSEIDDDNNGEIDLPELRDSSDDWFLAVDVDEDGQITEDEMLRGGEQGGLLGTDARGILLELDADGDGSISRDEYTGEFGEVEAAAVDRDVEIADTQDYAESVTERQDPQVPDLDADEMVSAEEAEADWDQAFSRIDTDDDNALAREEWVFDDGPSFEEFDVDGDGEVTRAEYMDLGRKAYEEALTESGGEQLTTRDYTESTAWRDEALVPDVE